ncbi:3-ketoacyl-ACP reductase [Flavobacterium sp. MFBS3-15]|uniref:3-ketoacyl-ACP reductase n=1 Tax=Flavobacterium sp. MFBS3-15 TaxID=2989816 RepID=UPI0022364678|nr:3-ketoacyl-ACP reductase [Flavobacterium sp. MFBS3-15]MCW4470807.1 3-ketoacyl-ACP reductase [Flavobacterium sp. MFBS3-15]
MENLKGQSAIITGAGKGLGKAIALELAKNGVNVGLIARTEADLKAVAEEVNSIDAELKVVYAIADITDNGMLTEAITLIKNELGAIDILVNNAGVGKFGKFLDLTVEEWENVVKTNVFGAYYATRALLPEMKERRSGDIVNISSSAGLKGAPLTSAYSASKFGLIGMSESLMQEVRKDNIRVFTMTPSTIATDMAKDLNLTDGNPETTLQPEDFAELLVGHLRLPRRAVVKDVSLWSTNP